MTCRYPDHQSLSACSTFAWNLSMSRLIPCQWENWFEYPSLGSEQVFSSWSYYLQPLEFFNDVTPLHRVYMRLRWTLSTIRF